MNKRINELDNFAPCKIIKIETLVKEKFKSFKTVFDRSHIVNKPQCK